MFSAMKTQLSGRVMHVSSIISNVDRITATLHESLSSARLTDVRKSSFASLTQSNGDGVGQARLERLKPRYLPKSLMVQAIGYASNQRPLLERFHGQVEIGRVRMWRGEFRLGLSVIRHFRPAVPHEPCRASVSTSCSSNRTCSFTASGSHLKPSSLRFRQVNLTAGKLYEAKFPIEKLVRILAIPCASLLPSSH